ncbi:MAG: hypothetical protein ACRD3W_11790, partial [Terriglobales bacterium]
MLPEYGKFCAKNGQVRITVYATGSPWQLGIIKQVPAFIERTEQIFGADLPHMSFYFFEKRKEFEESYPILLDSQFPYEHDWHDGTGNVGKVLFCDVNMRGEMLRGAGDVLHEYGHAMCHTIYGEDYLHHVPSWWNEGTADFVAAEFYREAGDATLQILLNEHKNGKFSDFSTLTNDFFRYPSASYAIGRLMVQELAQGHEP